MGYGMQVVEPRLALKAFAETGGSQPSCLFGLVPLCTDRLAQADVVALSEATPPWGFGENPGVDQIKKSGQSLHKGTQGKKRRKRQRKKERRSRRLPAPKRDQGRGLS